MPMRFPYFRLRSRRPVWTLGGSGVRPRPIVQVAVIGPTGTQAKEAVLDTGADDTVFPETMAAQLGIDLTHAPLGQAAGVGLAAAVVRYAEVLLRLTDGREFREWQARVGFTSVPMRWPLLGFAGCLQFFTATFSGDREEVELTVNSLYQGT